MSESILQQIIKTALPDEIITGYQSIKASTSEAFYVETHSNTRLLVKYQIQSLSEQLKAEAYGLNLLSEDNETPVVRPIDYGYFEQTFYLILPWIDSDNSEANYAFGEDLANMHLTRQNSFFGLEEDNFIGPTPQSNSAKYNWVDFYREERLLQQAQLASENGFADIAEGVDNLCARLDSILPDTPPASLLHGDLWAGNFLSDDENRQLMIDPCVYYGDREAEFGILTIFGGFSQEFYNGYTDCWPFEEGFEERLPIYQLYHYLNHLNLFGASYLDPCNEIIKRFR